MAKEITGILRQKSGGAVGFEKWNLWGQRLVKVEDPEGVTIPSEWGKAVVLSEDRPMIPTKTWNAIADLYIQLMKRDDIQKALSTNRRVDSGLEVAAFFTLDSADLTAEIQCWVPTQVIGHAHVEIDYEKPFVNIMTGEEVQSVHDLADSVMKVGTTHSHNSMGAFFSGTDDANEKGQPGIHLVGGQFKQDDDGGWTYAIATSIVLGGVRYEKILYDEDGETKVRAMTYTDVIDFNHEDDASAHESVWGVIEIETTFKATASHGKYLRSGRKTYGGSYGNYYGQGSLFAGSGYDDRYESTSLVDVCEQPGCTGYLGYDGTCWECGTWNKTHDEHLERYTSGKLVFVRDGDGTIEGYVYKGISGSYIQHFDKDKAQAMAKRWGLEVTDKSRRNENKSKRLDYTTQREQKFISHCAVDLDGFKGIVDEAIDEAGLRLADDGQLGGMKYTLKEFARILAFVDAHEPYAKASLMDALRHIASNQEMHIYTEDELAEVVEEEKYNSSAEEEEL